MSKGSESVVALLDKWSIRYKAEGNLYKHPSLIPPRLVGEVFGHPDERWPDGTLIMTSAINGLITNKDGSDPRIMTASGSVYRLGRVEEGYEQAFPCAEARILKNMKQFLPLKEEGEDFLKYQLLDE